MSTTNSQELIRSIIQKRRSVTRPLYLLDEKCNPDHYGSCTLLMLDNHFFVLTAAHLFDECDDTKIYVGHDSQLEELSLIDGVRTSSLPESGERDDDKIDVGYIEVDANTLSPGLRASFATVGDLRLVNDTTQNRRYLVTGYPLTKQRRDQANRVYHVKEPFTLTTELCDQQAYADLEFESHTNYLLHFEQKKVLDDQFRRMIAPKPKGISGGALWDLPIVGNTYITNENEMLVGINIEHRKERSCLVATNLKVVLAAIRDSHPGLRALIDPFLARRIGFTKLDLPED